MEAVTAMQCVQIRLVQDCAHVKWDIQGMEHIVRTSMNV